MEQERIFFGQRIFFRLSSFGSFWHTDQKVYLDKEVIYKWLWLWIWYQYESLWYNIVLYTKIFMNCWLILENILLWNDLNANFYVDHVFKTDLFL